MSRAKALPIEAAPAPTEIPQAFLGTPRVEDRIADVFDSARSFVHAARHAREGADAMDLTGAASRVAEAQHELEYWATGYCTICDEDTCELEEAHGRGGRID